MSEKENLRENEHKNAINSRKTKINLVDKQNVNEKEKVGKKCHEIE